MKNARVLLVFTCSAKRTKRQIKRNLFQLTTEFICFNNANVCKFMGKGLIGLSLLFMAQSWIPAFEIPNPNSNIEAPNVATKPCNQLPNFDFYFAKRKITRPSVNHAKDYIGQLFLIPGLVWSGKGYHLWMWSLWGSQQPFCCVTTTRPNDQPCDPSLSLLLNREKAVFCNYNV